MPFAVEERITPQLTPTTNWLAIACALKQADSTTRVNPTTDARTVPVVFPLASAKIRYLSAIFTQLQELLSAPETDEYGALRADRIACANACELLTDAAIISAVSYKRIIPNGCASTDAEGGVRIEWVRSLSGVRLVVPAKLKSKAYIYHEIGDSYDTELATPEALARWLREI